MFFVVVHVQLSPFSRHLNVFPFAGERLPEEKIFRVNDFESSGHCQAMINASGTHKKAQEQKKSLCVQLC